MAAPLLIDDPDIETTIYEALTARRELTQAARIRDLEQLMAAQQETSDARLDLHDMTVQRDRALASLADMTHQAAAAIRDADCTRELAEVRRSQLWDVREANRALRQERVGLQWRAAIAGLLAGGLIDVAALLITAGQQALVLATATTLTIAALAAIIVALVVARRRRAR